MAAKRISSGAAEGLLYIKAERNRPSVVGKGIFARPSIAQPRIARERRSRYDFAQGKIPSIFYHEAKMLACTDIFARPSMSHRAAYYAARAAARRRLLAFARSHVTIITHPTLSVNDAKLRAAITLSAFRNIIPLNTRKG